MAGNGDERMLIVLCLIATNWTFLFRNPVYVVLGMFVVYFLWFILIDSAHTLGLRSVCDLLAMSQGAALGQYVSAVLHLTKFVPHTNLALAKQLDAWTHHAHYWPVFLLGIGSTAISIGWLNWHWEWAFMIVALLYAVLVAISFVFVVGTMRHDVTTLHGVWLVLVLWQVLFFGAAQQIDTSVAPVIWVVSLTGAAFVFLALVNLITNVIWPPVNYSDPRTGIIIHDEARTVFGNPYGEAEDDDDILSEADSTAPFRPSIIRRILGYLRGEDMTLYSSSAIAMLRVQEKMETARQQYASQPINLSSAASAAAAGSPFAPEAIAPAVMYPSTYGPAAPPPPAERSESPPSYPSRPSSSFTTWASQVRPL